MSHTTKTIAFPKEWAKFVEQNTIKRGHPGSPWMSVAEIAAATGQSDSTSRRQVRGMKSCVAIVGANRVVFYRP